MLKVEPGEGRILVFYDPVCSSYRVWMLKVEPELNSLILTDTLIPLL
jgi:hypothetical protein